MCARARKCICACVRACVHAFVSVCACVCWQGEERGWEVGRRQNHETVKVLSSQLFKQQSVFPGVTVRPVMIHGRHASLITKRPVVQKTLDGQSLIDAQSTVTGMAAS